MDTVHSDSVINNPLTSDAILQKIRTRKEIQIKITCNIAYDISMNHVAPDCSSTIHNKLVQFFFIYVIHQVLMSRRLLMYTIYQSMNLVQEQLLRNMMILMYMMMIQG